MEEVFVVPDGSVRKATVKAGSARTPPKGATVFVDFVGRLVGTEGAGEVFDSTADRGYFSFTIGQEQTIPGLELAVAHMAEGEIAVITVAPSQAYGPMGNEQGFHGCGRHIPANATLRFELQLLDWDENPAQTRVLSSAGLLELAERLKAEGNDLFVKQNKVARAACKYRRAIACLIEDEDYRFEERTDENSKKKVQAMLTACYLNLAACQLKLARYRQAAETCRLVLEKDENNAKARFRLGKALAAMNELEDAKKELEKALALEELGEIRKELKLVEQRLQAQAKKQKQFYGKLFNKLGAEKDAGLGLYTDEETTTKPVLKKCNLCGEEVEEVQLARHIIKKHSKT